LDQHQVRDWEEEISEDEIAEEELNRVQQEIDRLHEEQVTITRRQAVPQWAKVRWQYIDSERARLPELWQTVDILC
jgi:hypothetical protein